MVGTLHPAGGGAGALAQRWRARRATAFRFLHVSTDEVYGSLGAEGLFTETTAYDPRSPYSASKAASDHLASAWFHTYGLPVVISNCSNNYGPYHFPEKLIPLVILNALEGKPLPVYGDGANVRDWLYVEDHARALRLIVERGGRGETYNVGGRNERTNLQVVQAVCDLLDELAAPRRERAPRADHLRRRPPGPRPPLRHRRLQAGGRARLARAGDLRHRAASDGALVPRPARLVGAAARPLRRRAPGPARAAGGRREPAPRLRRHGPARARARAPGRREALALSAPSRPAEQAI